MYLATLAPTVTLWDAGEFITAAKTLGIPHPPGTPLFVLLGNVWGRVVALGDYAWRLNLMSATFSAAGAGCLFLVAHEALGGAPRAWRLAAGAAAAAASAFGFTAWQNSNETEVYMVATFSVAAIAWLCLRWRAARGTPRAPQVLLLVLYLAALSIGNHLMTLLVGPAVAVFLVYVLRRAPAADPAERRVEWSQAAAVGTLWIGLVGVGLGSTPLLALGAAAFAVALALAARARAIAFPVLALAVAAVGTSTYAFLYVRSGLNPVLDMADPETWGRLLDVIRRAQYPARGLLDDPRFAAGPDNPGRTVLLAGQQLINYLQYFDWQWAAGIGRGAPAGLTPRFGVTVMVAALGVLGLVAARRSDPAVFWLLGTLWLVTGIGLVAYMNFKPGFSLFWDQYPRMSEHEVRERDYFFTLSFQTWGVFAGLGVVQLARHAVAVWGRAGLGVMALVLVPLGLNFTAASRRHGPDATLARDWAYNLLQSVGPYGVLFTFGDNDTYPLWHAQDVEGVRRDVILVNLSLANTEWHLRQVRDRVPGRFDPAGAPSEYSAGGVPEPPVGPLFELSDSAIGALGVLQLDQDVALRAGALEVALPRGTLLYPRDQAMLLIIARWIGRRPIAIGHGSWGALNVRLEDHLLLRGLAAQVFPGRRDTLPGVASGLGRIPMDVARTEYLVNHVFHYGNLFRADTVPLDPSARQVANSLAGPLLELAQVAVDQGDAERATRYLRRAYLLTPSPALRSVLDRLDSGGVAPLRRPAADPPRRP